MGGDKGLRGAASFGREGGEAGLAGLALGGERKKFGGVTASGVRVPGVAAPAVPLPACPLPPLGLACGGQGLRAAGQRWQGRAGEGRFGFGGCAGEGGCSLALSASAGTEQHASSCEELLADLCGVCKVNSRSVLGFE